MTNRINLFGDACRWYYSIDEINIPTTPIKTNTEAVVKLRKALHVFGAQIHASLFTWATWIAIEGSYLIAA